MEPNPGSSNPIAGALTYPTRSEGNAQPVAVQPRQPRNLQGLLRFAMEATKAEDAPGNSQLGPMDEERRKFLEEALKSLTVDIVQVIQDALKVLTDTEKMHSIGVEDELPEDVRTSFHNLTELIDDIDIANDFFKLGGLSMFPVCYGSANATVHSNASAILAESCQNNPFCQTRAMQCGLLNVLLSLLLTERGTALAKCLYAVSCCVREYEPACQELIRQGGCAALAQCLAAPEHAARTKAAFLIAYLCQHYSEAREQFSQLNLVKTIAEQIKNGRDESTEHLLSLLLALTQNLDPTVLAQCWDPTLQLKKVLEQHLNLEELKGDDYIEEKEYCQGMLKILENQPRIEVFEEVADR